MCINLDVGSGNETSYNWFYEHIWNNIENLRVLTIILIAFLMVTNLYHTAIYFFKLLRKKCRINPLGYFFRSNRDAALI